MNHAITHFKITRADNLILNTRQAHHMNGYEPIDQYPGQDFPLDSVKVRYGRWDNPESLYKSTRDELERLGVVTFGHLIQARNDEDVMDVIFHEYCGVARDVLPHVLESMSHYVTPNEDYTPPFILDIGTIRVEDPAEFLRDLDLADHERDELEQHVRDCITLEMEKHVKAGLVNMRKSRIVSMVERLRAEQHALDKLTS